MRCRSSYQSTAIASPKSQVSRKLHHWANWLASFSLLFTGGPFWLNGGIGRAQHIIAQIPEPSSVGSQLNVLSVNPVVGNDASGNGTVGQPFKTITNALRVAGRNTVILLAPGTYSASSGETFPLLLKAGVTIEGNPRSRGQDIVIKGGGVFCRGGLNGQPLSAACSPSQNVTIVGATQAGLTGVTVTNPNQLGYGLWIESSSPVVVDNTFTGNTQNGISVNGNSAPLIRSNYFYENGGAGLAICGASRPEVRDNVLSNMALGISIIQNATPRLMGNRISNNKDGVVVEGNAQPVLRNNIIINNERDGLVAIASSRPELGTSSDPGSNTFRSNGRFDISNKTSNEIVAAFGNQLSNRTEGRINWAGQSSASVGNPSSPARESSAATLNQQPTTNNQQLISTTSPPSSVTNRPLVTPTPAVSTSSEVANRPPAPNPSVETFRRNVSTQQQEKPLQLLSLTGPGHSLSSTVVKPISPSSQPSVDTSATNNGQGITGNGRPTQLPSVSASSFPVPTGLNAQTSVASANGQPTTPPLSSSPTSGMKERVEQQTPEVGRQITFEIPSPSSGTTNSPTSSNQTSNSLPVPSQNTPPATAGTQATQASPSKLEIQQQKPDASVSTSKPGLRYRVVVDANSDQQKAMVRSLVPDAFHTVLKGRAVMQVGIYSDRAYAEEMLQILKGKGLKAAIIEQSN